MYEVAVPESLGFKAGDDLTNCVAVANAFQDNCPAVNCTGGSPAHDDCSDPTTPACGNYTLFRTCCKEEDGEGSPLAFVNCDDGDGESRKRLAGLGDGDEDKCCPACTYAVDNPMYITGCTAAGFQ